MQEGKNRKEDPVRNQLTIRAAVWDVSTVPDGETVKLDAEWGKYGIWKLTRADETQTNETQTNETRTNEKRADEKQTNEKRADCQEIYMQISRRLAEAGIMEKETVIVTEHAALAAYIYGLRYAELDEGGMGVIFYEKGGESRFVPADMAVQGFGEIGIQFLDRVLKRRNHLPWNILYTERTCVREIALSDLDELYRLYEGEGITDYTEPLFERKKEEEYTKSYIKYMYYYYGYGMWIIRDRKTGNLIGRAGIEHREAEDEVMAELGYIIGREYQGMGYAQEVCRAIMEYAVSELEISELHCFIHPQNLASIHLAKKLGFLPCGQPQGEWDGLLHFCHIFDSSS